uniref:beta-fructofuranosidase, insoluble isoenzyme CWINV3 n=1 Tax=Erigeron canadensis TaxID=72917 RepID=UPI001CB9769C|nr:beta-fructofuranosidase, insoluble isoenzyme CWINV3 [Erigeron canadensis]
MKPFVVCVIYLCCVILLVNAKEIHDVSHTASPYRDQGRPQFHLRPPQNWINDPNGPLYYKGVYHLFYQYNPYGSLFNQTIVWAHSASYDLVNWIHLKHALVPSKPFDMKSCWSGSATILPGNYPVILYTGLNINSQQVQNLAMPKNLSDPFLQEWVKYHGNPLMTPPPGVDPDDFRDPTTAWRGRDGIWRVVVGGLRNKIGVAILYKSKNFIHWSLHHAPLYSGNENAGIWECPDFFPVSVNGREGIENSENGTNLKYVLKVSFIFNTNDYYMIGSYDADKEKFVPDKIGLTGTHPDLRYDYGKFYASKSFYDSGKKRRILWGWINESDSSANDIKKGWAGIQSIPRQVYHSPTGTQLLQWPVKEIESLRDTHVTYTGKIVKSKSLFEVKGITASQADIDISFKMPKLDDAEIFNPKWNDPELLCRTKPATVSGQNGPFGLLLMASQDLTEHTAVFFRVFKNNQQFVVLMCSDQRRSSHTQEVDRTIYGAFIHMDHKDEMISLRSLVDHSVIESFGAEGRACITARVYPQFSSGKEAHVYAFNNGSADLFVSTLNAWSMKKSKGN